jgi:ATP-dependent DNA ligase
MIRYFEFHGHTATGQQSHKFWAVDFTTTGTSITLHWGTIGDTPQMLPKPFPNPALAMKYVERKVNEKLNKGYNELGVPAWISGSSTTPAPAPRPPAGTPTTATAATPAARSTPAAPRTVTPPRMVPMLAKEVPITDVERFLTDDEYAAEIKLDGHRVLIVLTEGVLTVIGKDGQASQHLTRFKTGKHKAELDKLGNRTLAFDGELMGDGVLFIFDMPSFDGGRVKFGFADAWQVRHAALNMIFKAWAPDPSCFRLLPSAETTEDKLALLESQRVNLGEGIVIKRKAAPYKPGQRVASCCMKAKFVKTAECIVTELNRDGKTNAVLSVIRDGKLIEVGSCSMIGKGKVRVGEIVEVLYLYLGPGDKLVQPRFVKIRTDKPHAECTFDQLIGTNKQVAQ